tara:strand:- start:2541 stop:4733 length:2193 start_codon:yes stop_codon:yes gene_type:complete
VAAYAHSLSGRPTSEWETQEQHARRVAAAARDRADQFGGGDVAEALGLLHDLGKEKSAFQKRLSDPTVEAPHAAEGGRALAQVDAFGKALAGAIVGHHGRLPDPDRLRARLAAAETIPLPNWCTLPPLTMPPHLGGGANQGPPYRMQFLVRMLYGALTDADDRETAAFYAEANGRYKGERSDVVTDAMRTQFDDYMDRLSGDGPVNELRRDVLTHAREQGKEGPGLFTLTVPTGGGKTLTSLGFALDHALRHGLRRLIYVIPYASIVEQTADAFRKAFPGPNIVLEHHANADWDGDDESEAEQLRVMGASWDVPIVVTTAVQFFESLHAARKKRCRKLPALARSVIVLDEAQTMPLPLLRPCMAALSELIEGYGASVVLSTATQPALTIEGGFPAKGEALGGAREIAPDPPALYDRLRRVEVRDVGPMDDASLAERLADEDQALVIVDNRMQARMLFDRIATLPGARHLSTLMTPDHRRAVLSDVRADLKAGAPVRLVATSLIEAGVDVDFPLVLRAATGVDAIAQAAGRCNREGRMDGLGRVEVFRSEHPAPPAIEQFARIGRRVLETHSDDPIGSEAVAAYFRELWSEYVPEALDAATVGETARKTGILSAIADWGVSCRFETLERAFRMIDDELPRLAIAGGDHGADPEELERHRFSPPSVVAKLLRPHTIGVPYRLWRDLRDAGVVTWWAADQFGEQFAILDSTDHYDGRAGLRVDEPQRLDGLVF